ncbi:MAG: hypothetical protein L0922_01280, partial [Candidatus Mariimomonas ferrooxydans]
MSDIRKKFNDLFVRGVWEIDTDSLGKLRSFMIKSLRLFYVAMREFTEGQLTLRAMSLVYTTLLSIVPLPPHYLNHHSHGVSTLPQPSL